MAQTNARIPLCSIADLLGAIGQHRESQFAHVTQATQREADLERQFLALLNYLDHI